MIPCGCMQNKRIDKRTAEERRGYRLDYERRVQVRESRNKWWRELKQAIMTHYGGGKCACVKCDIDDLRVLSIDHINGGGKQHRQEISLKGGWGFYLWLKRNGFPEGYQTLCMNCQFIKRCENKEHGKGIKQ